MLINYFDSASTTKVDSRVLEAMLPYFSEIYGNASSNHNFGKESKQAIELSRKQVSKLIVIKTKKISTNTEVNKLHIFHTEYQ
ncbi:hypothetical protein LVDJXP189_2140006 [Flavobacterium psychrophilum]|uniref:aminotransferase class V-fold PLP-dependent enzyme n=1 Tax=Flavobacterium psychrophilum TaxID=96345 RepID=UPI000B7C116B|nr:aminotransferase class V-fold PLP-dependent enzyme [Flavobacterium psychrophilum]ELV7525262.1 aminotransferase class V-fold PLP-dependent enzyme [Flavobacterium psychrophilum]MCB6062483.1 aminotransferase class V-fold PLP-dependent enzyme [Flavobacterium psychrophilum]SNB43012.1 hypothetical protein LVDJXP189_2140006 [Flavobacterium psychrophilum]